MSPAVCYWPVTPQSHGRFSAPVTTGLLHQDPGKRAKVVQIQGLVETRRGTARLNSLPGRRPASLLRLHEAHYATAERWRLPVPRGAPESMDPSEQKSSFPKPKVENQRLAINLAAHRKVALRKTLR